MRVKIRGINRSRKTVVICFICLFVLMLGLNILTPMMVDDYIYAFSFKTGQRITSIGQIVGSMQQHYITMNGRLISHSLVQIMLMMPAWIFDILNAWMFCVLIYMMYYYSVYHYKKEHNCFLLLVIMAAVWKFTPAFGHVFLWLDGSVNYLWATVFALLYMFPIVRTYNGQDVFIAKWMKPAYILLGIAMGALSESLSMAVMGMLFLVFLYLRIWKKQKENMWMLLALFCCMTGYLLMMLSPGTWKSKIDGGKGLADSFLNVLDKYTTNFGWLLIVWIVLFILIIYKKRKCADMVLPVLFAVISVAINFLHVTANRYPDRSMIGVAVLLIIADACLFTILWESEYEVWISILGAVTVYYAVLAFFPGAYDILTTYRECKVREQYILTEKEKGNLDLEITVFSAKTKYSAMNKLRYLQTGTYDDWPNVYMASYYGVEKITGVKAE